MIQIVCDNCERVLEVEQEHAGGKVSCPHCGDVNRVPEAAPATPPPPVALAPATVGPAAELPSEAAPETEICVIRPAMFRAHPFRGLLITLLVIAGIVGALMLGKRGTSVILVYLALAVAAFGVGWFARWWIMTTLWIKVTITNKRTVRHAGIVRRHSTEVLHDHVRSVDINQNFVQRIFNVGYIGIDSAGQDGIEIEIRDIPGPDEIKRVIDRYRKM